MLLRTFLCKFLCGYAFSSWRRYRGGELLSQMVTPCLTFWRTARQFSQVAAPFYIPASSLWVFWLLDILTNACFCLPVWPFPLGVRWLWLWPSHPQCVRLPVPAQHPRQHLVWLGFWMIAILIETWWYLITILICCSLTWCDAKRLSIYLFVIRIFSLLRCLVRSFAYF